MKTSLSVEGANCPACFNETLENISQLDGVTSVRGSFLGSCIEIEHDSDISTEVRTVIRTHLHGMQQFSDETQMVVPQLEELSAHTCLQETK